jgi:predicted amidohydrolase YtcJ
MSLPAAPIVVYRARQVVTLDPCRPAANAVAVAEGRVFGVGDADSLGELQGAQIDDRYANAVIIPGFVEAHSHSTEGALWQHPYVGWFDRTGPDGTTWPGCRSFSDIVERLRRHEATLTSAHEPVLAWGLDPIYFEGERLAATHLDQVSRTRPVFLIHASLHVATVNHALLEQDGIGADCDVEGVVKDANGIPVGELREFPAMALTRCFGETMRSLGTDEAVTNFARLARNSGCTTVAELGSLALSNDAVVDQWLRLTGDPTFPVRVTAFLNPSFNPTLGFEGAAQLATQLAARSTERLRFSGVKILVDGSIQGFTARLRWPFYPDGSNGQWLLPPDHLDEIIATFLRAGLLLHAHVNGDEAIDAFLDGLEAALRTGSFPDHRTTLQHCQMVTADQLRRVRALGACVNLFANHLWFWGDQHHDITIGPDRANRIDPCASVLRHGIPLSIHSDASVTPLGQLHTMWCAVNRITPGGRVLGVAERISAQDALAAVTLGAAYQLKMDGEIGSIEVGKRADLAVLAESPLDVDPLEIRNIPVLATVLGGTVHEVG